MKFRHDAPRNDTVAVRRIVRFELAPQTLLLVGLAVAGVWLVGQLAPVLLVLVVALMIVGALNPIVTGLEKRQCRRNLAIAFVFGVAAGLVALGLFFTLPSLLVQVQTLIEHEPAIRSQMIAFLESSRLTQVLADGLRDLHYGDLLKNSRASLLSATLHTFEIMAYGIAAIFLAIYIMIDRDRLRGGVFMIVPRVHHVRFSRVLLNLETIVGGYIRGQVITCVLIGLFILALLLAFHVPNALALAVFGGVMDVLPYIGPLLTIAPAVIAAYAVGPGVAITVFALLLLYEEFESRVLIPLVYGRALRLPSSVVFVALLAGGVLAGIVGALLALPIASAVLMLLNELRVELPGATEQLKDVVEKQKDAREEQEYEERTEAVPVVEAAAVAVEIARERKEEDEVAAEQSGESK